MVGSLPARGGDRRLNVLRRRVDIPVQLELDVDLRISERAGGRELRHP